MKKIVLAAIIALTSSFGANDGDAEALTLKFLAAMHKPYQEFMNKCLDGNFPDIPAMRNAKCSFYDKNDYSYYDSLKDKIKFEKDTAKEQQNLDANYHDAMQTFSGRIRNISMAMPKIAQSVKANIEFEDRVLKIEQKDGVTWVYYSLSNLKDLHQRFNVRIYEGDLLHDGVLFLDCSKECKILPMY